MSKIKKQLKNELNKLTSPEELKSYKDKMVFRKRKIPVLTGITTGLILIITAIILIVIGLKAKVTFLGIDIMQQSSKANIVYKTSSIIQPDDKEYYAKPGETITLELSFDNDDYYDIISFVVCGTPYTSYMFKDGSNYEKIYVDFQIPNKSGTFYITVSEIKFIDNTTIKNVTMSGDDMIEIGIMYVNYNLQINDLSVSHNSIYFKLNTDLPIEITNNLSVKLVLDNQTISTLGIQSEYTFKDLLPYTNYNIIISGNVDLLDGKGTYLQTLLTYEITTDLPFSSELIDIGTDYVDFSNINAKVYYNNSLVTRITNLSPNTEYSVVLVYEYNGQTYSKDYKFKTLTLNLPTIIFDDLVTIGDNYLLTFKATDEYEYYVNNEKCSLYNGIYSATISNPNNIVVKVYLDGVYIGDVKYEKNSSTL